MPAKVNLRGCFYLLIFLHPRPQLHSGLHLQGAPGDQGARAPGRSAAPPRVRLARGAVPAADASLGRVASPRRPGRGGRSPALPAALGPPPLSTLAWGPGVGVGVGTVLASGVALQVRP